MKWHNFILGSFELIKNFLSMYIQGIILKQWLRNLFSTGSPSQSISSFCLKICIRREDTSSIKYTVATFFFHLKKHIQTKHELWHPWLSDKVETNVYTTRHFCFKLSGQVLFALFYSLYLHYRSFYYSIFLIPNWEMFANS